VLPDPGLDVGPRADGDDPAVRHRERFGGGPGIVDGEYGSGEDEIGNGHERDRIRLTSEFMDDEESFGFVSIRGGCRST
jgi:hypothetical protein